MDLIILILAIIYMVKKSADIALTLAICCCVFVAMEFIEGLISAFNKSKRRNI